MMNTHPVKRRCLSLALVAKEKNLDPNYFENVYMKNLEQENLKRKQIEEEESKNLTIKETIPPCVFCSREVLLDFC